MQMLNSIRSGSAQFSQSGLTPWRGGLQPRPRAFGRPVRAIEKQNETQQQNLNIAQAPGLQADEVIPEVKVQPSEVDVAGPGMPYQVLAGIAGLGVLETGYLTATKLLGSAPVCPVSGCESVLNSSYSELFGVPLSLFGMLAYGSVLAASLIGSQQRAANKDTATVDLALAAGTCLLGGVSGMLLYLLQTQFSGEVCVWCYGSAGLSFTLLALVVSGMPSKKLAAAAGPGLGAMAAAVLALYIGFGGTSASTAGEDFELPYVAPEVTSTSSSQAVTLAKRLKEAGARMYGAFWCSHCFDQKQTFGKEAMAEFPYEECYPNGWKRGTSVTEACDAAGVKAFPTWVINGKVIEGELTLDALEAELAGPERVTPEPPKSPFAE